jgi:hypothetical protein
MDVKSIGHEDVNLIHLDFEKVQWSALVNTIMKFEVP